ncbi:hypothetical protein R1sor_014506 [Riccia sorocarpa]|uniref:30S ribosomal protein S20, chloroplastic n=1 Tax=Riccia sorocarpa TaxID=122646 RepID=A0ABD3HCK5_9MARC
MAVSCVATHFATLSISGTGPTARPASLSSSSFVSVGPIRSCGFLSSPLFVSGGVSRCPVFRRRVVIRNMAEPAKKKKEDSAVKRARIAEVRRIYNKSRKTEIKTRMKKVFAALDDLKKKGASSQDDIKPVEALIAEAYSIIDKAVKVGTLHKNTGGNRKSRLARAKRALEIQMGWYTPAV